MFMALCLYMARSIAGADPGGAPGARTWLVDQNVLIILNDFRMY
jgi:hypothetical protein